MRPTFLLEEPVKSSAWKVQNQKQEQNCTKASQQTPARRCALPGFGGRSSRGAAVAERGAERG